VAFGSILINASASFRSIVIGASMVSRANLVNQ
jgi:hypothetical protein